MSAGNTDNLANILTKVYSLMPSTTEPSTAEPLANPSHLLTHLLHLSSKGYILPHVDNVEASAGSIVGISLGAERELVLEKNGEEIRMRLPAGSAYLQKQVCSCSEADPIWLTTHATGAASGMTGSMQSLPYRQQTRHEVVKD